MKRTWPLGPRSALPAAADEDIATRVAQHEQWVRSRQEGAERELSAAAEQTAWTSKTFAEPSGVINGLAVPVVSAEGNSGPAGESGNDRSMPG